MSEKLQKRMLEFQEQGWNWGVGFSQDSLMYKAAIWKSGAAKYRVEDGSTISMADALEGCVEKWEEEYA